MDCEWLRIWKVDCYFGIHLQRLSKRNEVSHHSTACRHNPEDLDLKIESVFLSEPRKSDVTFEVFTALNIHVEVFWIMTRCGVVLCRQRQQGLRNVGVLPYDRI